MIAYRSFLHLDGRVIRDVADRRLAGTHLGQQADLISSLYTSWAQFAFGRGALSRVIALLEGVLAGKEGVLDGREGVLAGREGVLAGREGVLAGIGAGTM